MRISSPTNPLVKRLRRLTESPRECREQRRTIAEGLHVVECALAAGWPIETMVLRADSSEAARGLARRAASAVPQLTVVELSGAIYDSVSPVEHGAGVLAELSVPASSLAGPIAGDAVYLDGVQDPGNAGALLRTAAAAGVSTVVAGPGTAYVWSPKVIRAAMGAHFLLRLIDDASLADAGAFDGEILAADVDGEDLFDADWGRGATMWIFGSEGQGLRAQARALAQRRLRIALAPGVESLNVAAAAAVCLFEQRRRRRAKH